MTLRRGDRGDDVARYQDVLRRWGAPIRDEPGLFGLWTEAAVFVLQHGEGLAADGAIGPHTAARLESATPPPALAGGQTLTYIEGVPYYSQRDNVHHPLTTCNVTSLAMALRFHGVSPSSPDRQLEDELYEVLTSPEGMAHYQQVDPDMFRQGYPVHEVFDNLVWVAQRYGVRASFSTQRAFGEIAAEIAAGRPVVLSGAFTGSGHIVLLVGLTAAGDLICNDPYGNWVTGYKDPDGAARIYSQAITSSVLKNIGSDLKWGLFLERTLP